jgi:hypothetical protein
MRLMSRKRLVSSASALIHAFNVMLGQIGNKLAVRAVRDR